MYVCICHRVSEKEVRGCIEAGARSEEEVEDACEAGGGCGTCLDRITDMLEAHYGPPVMSSEASPI
ncbi:MAG TPA: (2Fe-2S)-binding protein [Candidatus Stackebrandtia faecavium]|nr:(2Fe-2S)-binding protein [Candidatus Stackebrandtia faecavium]